MTRLLSILGPTASGKSSVAISLAQKLSAEIVSCDSMQIYRDMDIGTAKVSSEEQAAVKHHLIDVLDISEPFSAHDFQGAANKIILELIASNRQAILCGGTGLYARALLYGFDLRPSDKAIAKLIREAYENGQEADLIAELNAYDPMVYEQLKDNPRHWLRSLEVLRVSGTLKNQESVERPSYVSPEFILMPSPELSRKRITKRSSEMLENGWIEETEALIKQGLWDSPTAQQSIGYKYISRYLKDEITRDELLSKIIIQTSQYAKRQRTWFRNQHSDAIMIPVEESDQAEDIAQRILVKFL